jgi:hypothetical protein
MHAKKAAELLAKADDKLTSKDREERCLTACFLLSRYRPRFGADPRTEPIAAEQSKRILAALADGDWDRPLVRNQPAPAYAFDLLGLTEKDGWRRRDDFHSKEYATKARAWLQEFRDEYRIQRHVAPGNAPEKKKP